VSYRYVSQSWQLTEFSFFMMHTLLFLFLWLSMMIQFFLLISSSLLSILTLIRQESFSLCLMTTFYSYRSVSHQCRWELISHHTSTQFWFRVRVCWFLTVVLTVKDTVWHLFWNVVVCQNILMSVVTTVSDLIMLLTALYTRMMRMMTALMRVSVLLDWDRLH